MASSQLCGTLALRRLGLAGRGNDSTSRYKNGARAWLAPCARRISGPGSYAAEAGGTFARVRFASETGCNWNELSEMGIIASGTVRFAVPCRFFDSSHAQSLGSKISG